MCICWRVCESKINNYGIITKLNQNRIGWDNRKLQTAAANNQRRDKLLAKAGLFHLGTLAPGVKSGHL